MLIGSLEYIYSLVNIFHQLFRETLRDCLQDICYVSSGDYYTRHWSGGSSYRLSRTAPGQFRLYYLWKCRSF